MTEKSSTRETILAGALDLFADRGYSGVGVEELAASAGVTKPTLYHYFGNKQGVLKLSSRNATIRFSTNWPLPPGTKGICR